MRCCGARVRVCRRPGQPYVEQAARDKERAEQEKKDYDVRLVPFAQISRLTARVQNKKGDSGSGDGDEDDDE